MLSVFRPRTRYRGRVSGSFQKIGVLLVGQRPLSKPPAFVLIELVEEGGVEVIVDSGVRAASGVLVGAVVP